VKGTPFSKSRSTTKGENKMDIINFLDHIQNHAMEIIIIFAIGFFVGRK